MRDVADDAVVGDLEDGGFGVAVDGDDGFALVHAGEMLDGAGDADGDVELGLDGLAGLADLFGVGAPAGVDDGAGGADGGAELVGEGFDVLGEAFGAADAAAAGDDDLGFGEGDAGAALGGLARDLEARSGESEIDVELLCGFGAWRRGVEDAGFDGDDGDGAGGFDGFGDAGEVGVALRGYGVAVGFEADDVLEERSVEFDGDARAVFAAAAAAADEDDGGFAFCGDLSDGGGPELGIVLGEGGEIGDENLIDGAGDLGGDGSDVAARARER